MKSDLGLPASLALMVGIMERQVFLDQMVARLPEKKELMHVAANGFCTCIRLHGGGVMSLEGASSPRLWCCQVQSSLLSLTRWRAASRSQWWWLW